MTTLVTHTCHLTCSQDSLLLFERRLRQHAQFSREREAGCLKFDIYQSKENPCVFLLMEEYANEDAWERHQASSHVHSFRADTADWVTDRTWWFWRDASHG